MVFNVDGAARRTWFLGVAAATAASLAVARWAWTRHVAPPAFAGDDARLVRSRGPLPVPVPGRAVLSLLVLGQSNAGNFGQLENLDTRNTANETGRVLEHWQGQYFVARSPMLGATGTGACIWPAVGEALIAAGLAEHVVFCIYALDGAPAAHFAPGGAAAAAWAARAKALAQRFPPELVLWVQGEADFARRTSAAQYRHDLAGVRKTLFDLKLHAPLAVAVQTYCADTEHWRADNDIAHTQRALGTALAGYTAGPDCDALLRDSQDRHDGCHPSLAGQRKLVNAWAQVIARSRHSASEPERRSTTNS